MRRSRGVLERFVDPTTSRGLYLDPGALTEQLFGSTQTANMLMVGAAYQSGALPISAQSIERAIELNGVAVDANLQAFRRGRQAVRAMEGVIAATEERWRAALGARKWEQLRSLLTEAIGSRADD